jgi:hypothetical protein
MLPWEGIFLYPRTIGITRPAAQSSVGSEPYGGLNQATETTIATGLPASIQKAGAAGAPLGGIPGDMADRSVWRMFIPQGSVALGVVQDRDIVTDDQGWRYQVMATYWNSLGLQLSCELLEI